MNLDTIIAATVDNTPQNGRSGQTIIQQNHGGPVLCTDLGTTADGRVAMFSVGEVPWHGLGTVVSQLATSAEALQFAGLGNWSLEKVETFTADGIATGHFAIVRRDNNTVIGNVGSGYHVVSNEESFDFMDSLGGLGTRYETAGAFGNGHKVWILASMGSMDIVGDKMENYVLFSTTHDGSGAIKVLPTSVRVVCKNTYSLAMYRHSDVIKAGKGISMRHTKNVSANIERAKEALGIVKRSQEAFHERAEMLADKVLDISTERYGELVLDEILTQTVKGTRVNSANLKNGKLSSAVADDSKARKALDRAVNRRGSLLADILERAESDRNDSSAWGAVNAVTEHLNHSPLVRYRGSDADRAENRFDSLTEGSAVAATESALSIAEQYATAN